MNNQLKPDEIEILQILDEAPTGELVTITNISKETAIPHSKVSAILLKLERLEFIEKVKTKYQKNIPFIPT